VILYELLTGTEPFTGDPARVIAAIVTEPVPPPRTKRDDIPEALEKVIMRALAKDARERYPDVRALSMALAPFAPEMELVPRMSRSVPPPKSDAPVAATPRDAVTMVAPKPRRSRWLFSLGAVFVFVVGIVSWFGLRASASVAATPTHAPQSDPPHATITPAEEPTLTALTPAPTVTVTASASASSSAHHVAITKAPPATSTKRAGNPLTL
jgi:serine/threonine-protein kinase